MMSVRPVFLAVGTENGSRHREALPVEELPSWLDRGVEINRSLWDRDSLICHLDIEYVNFDDPAYAFLNEERIFALQQPVVAAAEAFLAAHGIHPLKLMTGRGYHLVWKIGRGSKAFAELADPGHVSASLKRLYATECAPTGEHVAHELGAPFAGLGLVMEFVADEVKTRASPHCEIPVELGAIETGGGSHGREMVSLDITEYADPLSSRVMRAPFSVYLKPASRALCSALTMSMDSRPPAPAADERTLPPQSSPGLPVVGVPACSLVLWVDEARKLFGAAVFLPAIHR